MAEDLLVRYGLDDAALTRREKELVIYGMYGMVPVGTAADVGIRDDLIRLHIIVARNTTPAAINAAIRDTIVDKKITFATTDYSNDLPPQTFAAKLPDILNPAFIKSKIDMYQLARPYKYSLLVLSCVAGKLSKHLIVAANADIVKVGGHQLVYVKTKYTDADFNKTEAQLLGNLKILFDNIFTAISKLGPKTIPRMHIETLRYPEYTICPTENTPTTPAESAAEIERFLMNNRTILNTIEQFYIQKAMQINKIIQLLVQIYAAYFGQEAAMAAYGECADC